MRTKQKFLLCFVSCNSLKNKHIPSVLYKIYIEKLGVTLLILKIVIIRHLSSSLHYSTENIVYLYIELLSIFPHEYSECVKSNQICLITELSGTDSA